MINCATLSLHRRALFGGFATLAASALVGGHQALAAVEQNTLKRRGVGLLACDPERASPEFTLFAPLFVRDRNVYLIDLQGRIVHVWKLPYAPGLSGYLTYRGTLFYNGLYDREQFSQPLSVQRRRSPGSGLERQGALGAAPPGPSSSRYLAA